MNLQSQLVVKICVFVIVFVNFQTKAEPPVLPIPKDIGLKAITTIMSINKAIKDEEFQKNVMRALEEISENIEEIKTLVTWEANRIIQELSVKIDMQIVNDFVRIVKRIDDRFEKQFMKYFMGNDTYQPETIANYINSTIDPSDFGKTLSLINEYTIPIKYTGQLKIKTIFDVLHDYTQVRVNNAKDCDIGESAHQQMYAIYNLAIMAVAKGYIMVAHAYKYRQQQSLDPENSWKSELRDTEEGYKESVIKISQVVRGHLTTESRVIRGCDPRSYIEGVNYKRYQFLSTYFTYMDRSGKRQGYHCAGKIRHCKTNLYIQGACPALPETGRIYEYIWEFGGIFAQNKYYKGRQKGCKSGEEFSIFIYMQSARLCLCEEAYSQSKGALFNMTAQYTDIANNRVVTGIRFRSKWSITYIEIQDGELVNGIIDPKTVKWNNEVTHSLKDYERISSVLPDNKKNTISKDPHSDENIIDLKGAEISFNLDDVILPVGMVVAGVKFEEINGHISLMVAGWRVYDEFGYPVSSNDVEWFSEKDFQRSELNLGNLDIPTEGKKANLKLSEPGKQYIKFQMTGWNVDASQTVVPFLDLTEVVTKPPAPLGGIGIFHKAQQGYGGFMALKLITPDNTFFISDKNLDRMLNQTAL